MKNKMNLSKCSGRSMGEFKTLGAKIALKYNTNLEAIRKSDRFI